MVSKDVKIRKPRTCIICKKEVPKGAMMRCETNPYDHFSSSYFCLDCADKKDKIADQGNDVFATETNLRST